MEELSDGNNGKKRVRDNSDVHLPEEKRVDSENSDLSSQQPKRSRKDSDLNSYGFCRVESDELRVYSPESTRIPNDILDILNEPDPAADCDSAIQDLDSVIKSFEEEILHPSPSPADFPMNLPEYCESQVDLGYLLEASDDELGLPPTAEQRTTETGQTDLATAGTGSTDNGDRVEILGLEGEFSSYEPFGFGVGEDDDIVAVGGLFYYESADLSEFVNRPESLHV